MNRALLQGIHDISTILAIEATRDLEEEPVSGVRGFLSSKGTACHKLDLA